MTVVAIPLDSTMILGGLMLFCAGVIFGGLVGFIIGRA